MPSCIRLNIDWCGCLSSGRPTIYAGIKWLGNSKYRLISRSYKYIYFFFSFPFQNFQPPPLCISIFHSLLHSSTKDIHINFDFLDHNSCHSYQIQVSLVWPRVKLFYHAAFNSRVTLRFVPFHFVSGHFVPVISSPSWSFHPRSFRPLVISSPGHFVPSYHTIYFHSTK
jgi:hypothetical protein